MYKIFEVRRNMKIEELNNKQDHIIKGDYK